MRRVTVILKTPGTEQLAGISALLAESGLPTDDLEDQDLSLFRFEGTDDLIEAVGGLERCGDVAMLRSVATCADRRGHGVAGAIVEALEALSRREGIQALYLLTDSAESYFGRRGYSTIRRSEVPPAIRETRQYASLCPDSAVAMCKRLDQGRM